MPDWHRLTDTRACGYAGAFVVFALLGVFLLRDGIAYPMMSDDLHIVRSFSSTEVAGVLHGTWDPDGIETPGYRPGTVLFNMARFYLFGENVVAHRLFLILLFAAYLTLVVVVAVHFRMTLPCATAAGLLFLAGRYNASHYMWLADGTQVFQGLLVALALMLLLRGVATRHGGLYLGSLVLAGVAILVREDMLGYAPVLPILGYASARARRVSEGRPLLAYSAGLALLCVVFLSARRAFVPAAQGLELNIVGVFIHAMLAMNTMGWTGFNAATTVLVFAWAFFVLMLTASKILFFKRAQNRLPFVWLACMLVTCAIGLNVVRANLLFFPMTFMALFLCALLSEFVALVPRLAVPAAILLLAGIGGGAYMSGVTVESFHPDSATAAAWDGEFFYGKLANKATIPSLRAVSAVSRLAALGIQSREDYENRLPLLIMEAAAQGHVTPGPPGTLFVPRLEGIFQP